MRRPKQQVLRNILHRGFTLLEVMAALAILTLPLLALLDGVRSGTMAFMRTRDLMTAEALARQVMTEQVLLDEVPLDGQTDNGQFDGETFERFSWDVRYDVNDNVESLKSFVPDLKQSLFLITVTIKWDDDGLEQTYSLKSVRLFEVEQK